MQKETITQYTDFKIKEGNVTVSGYKYLPIHNISFQGKDGPGTLKEILKMIKENNTHYPNQCYTIELIIKRKEGEILEFKPKSGSQSLCDNC
jgi:hypothetical protein